MSSAFIYLTQRPEILETHSHRVSNVDEVFAHHPLAGEYVQLTPGNLGLQTVEVVASEVEVRLVRTEQTMHLSEALVTEDLVFPMITRAQRPTRFNGREVLPGQGVAFQTGRECEIVIPGGTEIMDLRVKSGLAKSRGWKNERERFCVASSSEVDRLAALLSSLSGRLSSAGANGNARRVKRLGEQIVTLAEELIAGGLVAVDSVPHGGTSGEWRLVRKAVEWVDREDDPSEITVGRLARGIGVSERTLHYAFTHTLETSPYQYLLRRKLTRLRRALLRSVAAPGAVTRAAKDTGFDHLSRMTEMYRRQFGETPRETLRGRG